MSLWGFETQKVGFERTPGDERLMGQIPASRVPVCVNQMMNRLGITANVIDMPQPPSVHALIRQVHQGPQATSC